MRGAARLAKHSLNCIKIGFSIPETVASGPAAYSISFDSAISTLFFWRP